MLPRPISILRTLALAACLASPAAAQQMSGGIEREGGQGRMTATGPNGPLVEVLRFEPWELRERIGGGDVVLLMRHGPTDWSKRDVTGVDPEDCDNQRVMTEQGKEQMRELGALMVANGLRPGRIVVSQWCRNQQTLEAIRAGMLEADATALDGIPIETMGELNLLLSLGGAPDVAAMRDFILDWEGSGDGPLLIISHFTNIQELTERAVFEGEILMIDPSERVRVMGQLRLDSAQPDVGHFE